MRALILTLWPWLEPLQPAGPDRGWLKIKMHKRVARVGLGGEPDDDTI